MSLSHCPFIPVSDFISGNPLLMCRLLQPNSWTTTHNGGLVVASMWTVKEPPIMVSSIIHTQYVCHNNCSPPKIYNQTHIVKVTNYDRNNNAFTWIYHWHNFYNIPITSLQHITSTSMILFFFFSSILYCCYLFMRSHPWKIPSKFEKAIWCIRVYFIYKDHMEGRIIDKDWNMEGCYDWIFGGGTFTCPLLPSFLPPTCL